MAHHDGNSRESLRAKVADLANQVASSLGMEVVLVEVKGGGSRSIVRVFIDCPGGVSLSDCERFSKSLSVQLDVEDWIPFSYILEVSSPGLERPLVTEADYVRFTGRRARVRMRVPTRGQRNFKGLILGVSEGLLFLETAPGQRVELALAEVEKANLLIEQ